MIMGILKYHLDQIVKNLEAQRVYFNNLSEMHPSGSLQIRKYKGNNRFVHSTSTDADENKSKRRIISDNESMMRAFACGQYGRAAMSIIEHNEDVLRQVSHDLIDLTPENIRDRLPRIYKELPKKYFSNVPIDGTEAGAKPPITKEYMRIWAGSPYKMSDYLPEERSRGTSRGLQVRSKSEMFVCEKLYEYDLPFRYEQEIKIGRYSLAPDFTFLDRNGEEFYLEYCGMMNDQNYIDKYHWRDKLYESVGINQWDNLIYFYEKNNDINLKTLDGMIRVHILPRIEGA